MVPLVKVCLKSDYIKQDGTVNIRIRITHKRKVKYFPVNIFVKPKNFLSGRISRSDPEHFKKNLLLEKLELKAKNIIMNFQLHDHVFTFDKFQAIFLDKNYGDDSFYAFADDYIKHRTGMIANDTLRMYKSNINKLKEFKRSLSFNDLTLKFIDDLEKHLLTEKKNNKNTISKTFTVMRCILNKAKETGKITEHVFDTYSFTRTSGNREFLTIEELHSLEGIYFANTLPRSQMNVLRYFLFSCYTGLRYQDVKNLRYSNIINREAISIQMHKTGKTVKIPLTDKAKGLIPPARLQGLKVFRVFTNQPTNRYLKDIMKEAGIKKQISFHCSRHTFATCSLDLKIPIEVVKEILGHTDLRTTAIYARIRDGRKKEEMSKWNQT